jgi:dimethylargininase
MFTQAIARKPGKNFAQGLTTTVSTKPPQYELLLKQHETYLETLKFCGLDVTILDPLPDYPDAYFVEDTAVVTPDVAVITHPGAETRQGEEDSMVPVLAGFRKIERIPAPGTLDGGDVLQVGNHFIIGVSERTNKAGAEQLGRILEGFGNTWVTIPVGDGLHFKSSVNYVGKNTLLVTPDFVEHAELSGYDKIVVEKVEGYAANTLLVNGHLLTPAGFPGTRQKLEVLGLKTIELETSELRKMDGGLTCMSIRF